MRPCFTIQFINNFDFRIKQKTLSHYCTSYFSYRCNANIHFLFNTTLLITIISSIDAKALYDSKNVSLLHFYICVLHHSFILYADKSPETSLFIIKRREDFFPFVKKQASPITYTYKINAKQTSIKSK